MNSSHRVPLLVAFGVCVAGCAPFEQSYFPVRTGQVWTYQVQSDFDTYVDDIKVVGSANVGAVKGWKLQGRMGTSCLGWSGDTLIASELGGRSFDPPLPVFSRAPKSWKGTISVAGRRFPASAKITSQKTTEKLGGRSYEAWQTTVVMTGTGQTVQLDSWFVSGVGLLRQEQRTGTHRDRRLEYLSTSR